MPKKKCEQCADHHTLHVAIKDKSVNGTTYVDEAIVVRGGQKAYLWLGVEGRCVGIVSGATLRKIAAAVAKETQRTNSRRRTT